MTLGKRIEFIYLVLARINNTEAPMMAFHRIDLAEMYVQNHKFRCLALFNLCNYRPHDGSYVECTCTIYEIIEVPIGDITDINY